MTMKSFRYTAINLLKVVFFFTALYAASAATTQPAPLPEASCSVQVPYGAPHPTSTVAPEVAKTSSTLICRDAYEVLSDTVAKIPVWVAYTLAPEHAVGCIARSNAFATDQSLPEGGRAMPGDYVKSGYDIGHIAPDGDMSWNEEVEHESFILSNMTPQLPNLNRGIWKELESDVRAWAYERSHTILVYAGPVYAITKDKTIGKDNVVVPDAFYKIVVDTVTGEYTAFLFPQQNGLGTDLEKVRSTVAEVSAETGITFPLPPDAKETDIWSVDLGTFARAKKAQCGSRAAE
jgi:endonuclease G